MKKILNKEELEKVKYLLEEISGGIKVGGQYISFNEYKNKHLKKIKDKDKK